jgi:oligopeptidase B
MKRFLLLAWVSLSIFSGCQSTPLQSPSAENQPPIAKKVSHITTIHGDRLVDNYYWLRQKDNPEVRAYLKAEDAYADWFMKPTKPLQETLYQEMLGRVQEPDESVPYRQGDWFYYHRTEAGKQYPINCRKKGNLDAPEEVVFDLNKMAEGKEFLEINVNEVSDDGNLLAFSTDETGFRDYTLYVKDLRSGEMRSEKIPHVSDAAWASNNETLFYVTEDDAKRPYRVWRHNLGEKKNMLVYEEKDALFDMGVNRSRSKRFVYITISSKTTDDVRYLRADHPDEPLKVIAPRQKDLQYNVEDDGENLFYIRTNDKGRNFRIVTAPISNPRRENWKEIVPQREDVSIDDLGVFTNRFVLAEREHGLPQISVHDIATGAAHHIQFPEASYNVTTDENAEFNTTQLRFTYDSLTTPPSVYDYDMLTHERRLLKRQPVKGGYDPELYQTERVFATAADGTRVPISLVYRKGLKRKEGNPLLLYAYGSYGYPSDVWFSSNRLSLLDRGVIVAIAHVRGGGEFGKRWHDAGRMLNKRNTFTDFIACARYLDARHYTDAQHTVIEGASAGGLLIGAVVNMQPRLFKAALAEVPFVDVINTMLDESLPLTVGEFEEWGNPKIRKEYDTIKTYSPYDNVRRQAYPALLVESSLNDSQVMYWEPSKYVAKLRANKTDSNPLVFQINMEPSGHGGKSGRYDALHDVAYEYAFMLWEFGIRE